MSTLAQAVYPNGTGQTPATGYPCRVYRGWPAPANLDADLKAGKVNISVYPLAPEQNLTRYAPGWQELPRAAATLTVSASGQTVTFGGTPSSPLNAAVLVNGKAYVYPVQPNDTLTAIATALAALVSADTPASSTGPSVTVPAAQTVGGRIGRVGTLIQEVKRQKKSFRITAWCPSPQARDAVAAIIDPALSSLSFLAMPDGSTARLRYERSDTSDGQEKALLFRRDFVYSAEYATTRSATAAEVVSEAVNVTGGGDPSYPPITTIYS